MVTYEIDKAHTTVGFTARHLAVSTVRGQFNKFDGRFEGPDDDVTKTTGEVKLEVASIGEAGAWRRLTTSPGARSRIPGCAPS